MKDKNLELMEKAPVPKAILTLALPTIFSSIATLLYNLADTYFVGLLDDTYQLGAVSLAYPVFIIMQAVGSIFGIGVAPYISRCLGAKKYDEVKKVSSVTVYTSVVATFALMAIYFILRTPILNILGTSANTFTLTRNYLDIVVAFAFTMTLQTVLGSLLRAEGKSKHAVIEMVIGTVVNIILDPIFILPWGLNMGVVGAALATVIGIAVADIYCLIILLKGNSSISLKIKDFKPSKQIYIEVFKIGIPACAGQLLMSVTNAAFNNIAAGYGDYVISAYGVAGKMIYIALIVVNSYAGGYMPFAGYNLGANRIDRVTSAFKFTLITSTILSMFLLIPFVGVAQSFMSAFTTDQLTIDAGVMILRTWAICIPFLGVQFTMMSTLQVFGQAARAMIVNIGRQSIFFFPFLYLFNQFGNLTGLFMTNPVADIVTTIVATLLVISPLKELLKAAKEVA